MPPFLFLKIDVKLAVYVEKGLGRGKEASDSMAYFGVEILQEESTILTPKEGSLLQLREPKGRRKSHGT